MEFIRTENMIRLTISPTDIIKIDVCTDTAVLVCDWDALCFNDKSLLFKNFNDEELDVDDLLYDPEGFWQWVGLFVSLPVNAKTAFVGCYGAAPPVTFIHKIVSTKEGVLPCTIPNSIYDMLSTYRKTKTV